MVLAYGYAVECDYPWQHVLSIFCRAVVVLHKVARSGESGYHGWRGGTTVVFCDVGHIMGV